MAVKRLFALLIQLYPVLCRGAASMCCQSCARPVSHSTQQRSKASTQLCSQGVFHWGCSLCAPAPTAE